MNQGGTTVNLGIRKSSLFLVLILVGSGPSGISLGAPENSLYENQESLTLVSAPYTIEAQEGYHTLVMEGFYTRGPPGAPLLPQKTYDVELPVDAQLKTVTMRIESTITEDISGYYNIGAAPPVVAGSSLYSTGNTTIYTTDADYPASPVTLLGTYQSRGKKTARIQFTPFQYNPVKQTLVLNKTVNIVLSWRTNPAYTAPAGSGVGYVIVTTNAILSNSTQLGAFAYHVQAQGFSVYIITETHYGAAGGQQRAVNIRNWLQSNYLGLNLKYVLLVGNPDPDDPATSDSYGDVPMMMCWPNPGSAADQTPTDYFYADLTGNWDSNGNSQFGEFGMDAVDFGPEVYVGRIPVYGGDYASLDHILTKFITFTGADTKIMLPVAISNYQNEENVSNGCVSGWIRTDGLNFPQQVLQNITDPMGYSNFVMYETAGVVGSGHDPVTLAAYGFKAPLTSSNVITQWANDYGIVFWWAHGSATAASRKYWWNDLNTNSTVEDGTCGSSGDELAWPTLLSTSDTASLPDMETFTFQASCLNGYPESSQNLQYSLLKRGAVSTVGSTRTSWYGQGVWTFSGITDNVGIGYMYVGNLVFGQTAGESLYNGKGILINIWGWQGWQNLFDFNLYGDPSMYLEGPLVYPSPPEPPTPTPPRVQMCPLAKGRIDKALELLDEAKRLLEKARGEEFDTSYIEEMIAEAEVILEKAQRYCLGSNCIAGNYFAIKATEVLLEAIEELNRLLYP
jgi:hypothetical protein